MGSFTLHDLQPMLYQIEFWTERHVLLWSSVAQFGYALVLVLLLRAYGPRLTRALEAPAERLQAAPLHHVAVTLCRIAPWVGLLLLVWFGKLAFRAAHQPDNLLRLVESFTLAWLLISMSSRLVRNPRVAQAVAVLAFIIAALNIAGLLGPAAGLLDAMAVTIGTLRVSALSALKGSVLLMVLLWAANLLARLLEQRLQALSDLTPAMQVLAAKLARIVLLTLAVVLALGAVGIDLTAFAVFSGAIGVGIGFGLQKVVSNLVSGVILLLDRSVKPGDVIEIEEHTYGWITQMNARYVSVVTRDGTEYLIPNEDLITQRVTNWSYSNDLVRLHVPIGVAYGADLRQALALALDAASAVPRVLKEPKPVCLVSAFGESTVNLDLRLWISDPRNGTANVRSEVMLNIWDRYKTHGIELPFPTRDLNIRDAAGLARALAEAIAEGDGAVPALGRTARAG
jgi:small-conductance mechanosensitive channel